MQNSKKVTQNSLRSLTPKDAVPAPPCRGRPPNATPKVILQVLVSLPTMSEFRARAARRGWTLTQYMGWALKIAFDRDSQDAMSTPTD